MPQEPKWSKERVYEWFGRHYIPLYGRMPALVPNELQLIPVVDVSDHLDELYLVGFQASPEIVLDSLADAAVWGTSPHAFVEEPDEGSYVAVRTKTGHIMLDERDLGVRVVPADNRDTALAQNQRYEESAQ